MAKISWGIIRGERKRVIKKSLPQKRYLSITKAARVPKRPEERHVITARRKLSCVEPMNSVSPANLPYHLSDNPGGGKSVETEDENEIIITITTGAIIYA